MEEIQTKIFNNPSAVIKKISKILYIVCIMIGGLTLFVGVVHLLSAASDWDENIFEMLSYTAIDAMGGRAELAGYTAKTQILQGLYILLAGLATIPIYGFGCIVEDIAEMKKLAQKDE